MSRAASHPFGFPARINKWNRVGRTLHDRDMKQTALITHAALVRLANPRAWNLTQTPGTHTVVLFVSDQGFIYVARDYSTLVFQMRAIRNDLIVGAYTDEAKRRAEAPQKEQRA